MMNNSAYRPVLWMDPPLCRAPFPGFLSYVKVDHSPCDGESTVPFPHEVIKHRLTRGILDSRTKAGMTIQGNGEAPRHSQRRNLRFLLASALAFHYLCPYYFNTKSYGRIILRAAVALCRYGGWCCLCFPTERLIAGYAAKSPVGICLGGHGRRLGVVAAHSQYRTEWR